MFMIFLITLSGAESLTLISKVLRFERSQNYPPVSIDFSNSKINEPGELFLPM
jgi:hypothetical protein